MRSSIRRGNLAEFTGERVIPGVVDPNLLNEHVARYAFAARIGKGKRVLDAGCGAGYGSAELAKTALAVVGADSSSEASHHAREHYRLPNLSFEQAACSALPHRNASFDLVVAFEVIEHLSDWREFLNEVRRVLMPAGQFVVSTPNKLYYAEARQRVGANPFHQHEFEFAEFREELSAVFPHIALFLENHVEGVIFQPVEPEAAIEVRVDQAEVSPAQSHFFVAVCAPRTQTAVSTFVYIPSAGNVLREREQHIGLLEGEVKTKDAWLEKAKNELAALNEQHQKLLEMFRDQQHELEERSRWGQSLNRELESAAARIDQLQNEAVEFRTTLEACKQKVAELEGHDREKTEWARNTARGLDEKIRELAQCVEHLHAAEKTVEERTAWAARLQVEIDELRKQLELILTSRWVRLGGRLGLGPAGRNH
jgi:SAM-dependent methyltransferase